MPARNGDWNRFAIGRGDAVPAQRVQERGEAPRIVEPASGQVVPALLREDAAVDLVVPQDFELLALRVVVGARKPDDRAAPAGSRRPPRRAIVWSGLGRARRARVRAQAGGQCEVSVTRFIVKSLSNNADRIAARQSRNEPERTCRSYVAGDVPVREFRIGRPLRPALSGQHHAAARPHAPRPHV